MLIATDGGGAGGMTGANRGATADPHTAFRAAADAKSTPTRDTVSIEVNAFIPQPKVNIPLLGTYGGDGRGVGDPGTHRTQQIITVTEDASGRPQVDVHPHIGPTHKLDDKGKPIGVGAAEESTVQANWRVEADGTVVVHLHGQSANPLAHVGPIHAPGITYDETVTAKKQADGRWEVGVRGEHDGFPGYEVIARVNDGPRNVVYGYDPRVAGNGPLALFHGDGPVGVGAALGGPGVRNSRSGIVEGKIYTPEQLVAEHTRNGRLDAAGLGRDLDQRAEGQAGIVDSGFVEHVLDKIPAGQRQAVADAYFGNAAKTHVVNLGPEHDEQVLLAGSDAGIDTLLRVGRYAGEGQGLDAKDTLYTAARTFRQELYEGQSGPTADQVQRVRDYVTQVSDNPDAARFLGEFLRPFYGDDKARLEAAPGGRQLGAELEAAARAGR